METRQPSIPDNTAVRTALWRALHVQLDAPPHVLDDAIGLQLVAPEPTWRERPDMNPVWTAGFRASIVARARFIEDLVRSSGVSQYVLLGAGLDTFAQREPELGGRLRVFEVDQPETQAWKQRRLAELGLTVPAWLRFAPVDFEAQAAWLEALVASGFDRTQTALVASAGVSMYLTREAIVAMLRQVAGLCSGSTLAMTFLLPSELLDPKDRPGLEMSQKGARASGTPFLSFFSPEQMLALARDAGFAKVEHVSGRDLADRYFAGRADGLRPSTGEDLLIATV